MTLKTIKKNLTTFVLDDKNDVIEINMVGVYLNWEEFFIPWLITECEEIGVVIDFDKEHIDGIFEKLKKAKNITLDVMWLNGSQILLSDIDEVIVGVLLDNFNEACSIKRIKCDVYNELEKMGITQYLDNSEGAVKIFPTIVTLENDKKEMKEVTNG